MARKPFGHDLRELLNSISKSVGHLTIERLDKLVWFGDVLFRGLSTLIELWINNLTDEARRALFDGVKAEAERASARGTPWIGVDVQPGTTGAKRSYTKLRRR
jgi:hypothetical protein